MDMKTKRIVMQIEYKVDQNDRQGTLLKTAPVTSENIHKSWKSMYKGANFSIGPTHNVS